MSADAQELGERQQEMWRRGAEGWDRRQQTLREKTAPVARWLVNVIDPRAGERVLELAAGPGETGLIAAQRLGPDGRLISTDQAPEMVAIARRRAAELGLENVDFDVIDAQQMELEPGSFDAVLCRWGYMLMADPDEALRRTRRVLKQGGRLAMATWDRPDRNLWMSAPVIALVSEGMMPPPNPGDPSPFAMPDPGDIERRLRAAGFSSARAELITFPQTYASFEAYWEETIDMSAPILGAVEGLQPDEVAKVRAKTQETLSQFTSQDGRIEAPANAVVAAAVA